MGYTTLIGSLTTGSCLCLTYLLVISPLGYCVESLVYFRWHPKTGTRNRIFLAMSEPQDTTTTTTAPSTAAPPVPAPAAQEPAAPPQQQSPQVSSATAASAAATAAAATAAVASPPINGTTTRPAEELSCLWQNCTEKCPSPEALYVSCLGLFSSSYLFASSCSSLLALALRHLRVNGHVSARPVIIMGKRSAADRSGAIGTCVRASCRSQEYK